MGIEADLVEYLAAQASLSLAAGTNLFEGPMPESPTDCVAIAHYASEQSDDYVMGASLTTPGLEVTRVQLMVRKTDKAAAVSLANAAHRFLDNLQSYTPPTSSKLIFAIESDGPPSGLGKDGNNAWRYVANYRVQARPV